MPEGPPPWPRSSDAIRAALDEVHRSGDWGRYHGAQCEALAAELAAFHQPEGSAPLDASLCCSGTIAVELALRGLGVGADDEVILAAYDFPGNFRAIEAAGAHVVLVDIDPRTASVDLDQLPAAVGPRTKALIVSHLHGGMAPMRKIMQLAAQLGIAVVEDACQAMGAKIDGRQAGAWGDAGVLSFGGSKLVSAGRGGAVLSAQPAVNQRIKVFSERGNQAFPLSELQAAVIRPQLHHLQADSQLRAARAQQLLTSMAHVDCLDSLLQASPANLPGLYKLGFWYSAEKAGDTGRGDFLAAVQAEGVALFEGFRGFARRGARRCRKVGELPHALAAADRMVILHHPVLLEPPEVIERLASALAKVSAACPLRPSS